LKKLWNREEADVRVILCLSSVHPTNLTKTNLPKSIYKGRKLGLSPADTNMGFAIAGSPTGPYIKHPSNPVLASGHEVCVWPHREGIAA
jgi:hypothetical protein